ncbi:MAG TPA: hypothetical protein VK629_00500, partial [Steroidobacteraceae bacterium]|nr:hypothetical protein [Steroidobacteraceae bacterium]
MSIPKSSLQPCLDCKKRFEPQDLIPIVAIRELVVDEIRQDHPGCSGESKICRADLNKYRSRYVHSLLVSEKGELTSLEKEVLTSMHDHELLAKNVDGAVEGEWTLGERLADRIATFGGSWWFLIAFGSFVLLWI